VRGFRLRWPTTKFVWLIGTDNLGHFHLWRDWPKIAREIPIAVIARPGDPVRALLSPFARRFANARITDQSAKSLPVKKAPAWSYLSAPMHPHSSTAIRNEKAMARKPKV